MSEYVHPVLADALPLPEAPEPQQADGWECPACGTGYREKEDAQECCFPPRMKGWLCGVCGLLSTTKQEASKCCAERLRREAEIEAEHQELLRLCVRVSHESARRHSMANGSAA